MSIVVTGSSGHLGEGLVLTLRDRGETVVGIDVKPSRCTDVVGSVHDRRLVADTLAGARTVLHTATLHKPHVVTHSKQEFVDTNVSGTLALLELAVEVGVESFVFVSTTSTFGNAMRPAPDAPAVWVTEDLRPIPKNIYGVTKTTAEQLCGLVHQRDGLPVLILRTSRFFPEIDDDEARRAALDDANLKTIEYLNRRVDIEDVVDSVLLAAERAPTLGFDTFIISATSPFTAEDLPALRGSAGEVLAARVPEAPALLESLGWSVPPDIGRVYVNARARERLGWAPRHDFLTALRRAAETGDWRSPLALRIGRKGYHDVEFEDGPFPVE